MKAPRLLVLACALLLAAPPAAGASALQSQIVSLVARSRFAGDRTGLAVYDRGTGRLLAVYHGRHQMRPASNVKLTTSASVLGRIGFTARLSTRVLARGTLSAGTLHGNLWLVGDGDPSFSTVPFSRLAFKGDSGLVHDLAAAVRRAGVRRVTGGGIRRRERVRPRPARAALEERLVRWTARRSRRSPSTRTSCGSGRSRRRRRPPCGRPRNSRLPCERQGVAVGHRSHTGVHPASARPLAAEPSPTMHKLVYEMDQVSDNFFAETLTKDIAVADGRLGTTPPGSA